MSYSIILSQDQSKSAYLEVANTINIIEEAISKNQNDEGLHFVLNDLETLLNALEISLTIDVDLIPYAKCISAIHECMQQY